MAGLGLVFLNGNPSAPDTGVVIAMIAQLPRALFRYGPGFGDDFLDVGHQARARARCVIRNAVFDSPFDAAGVNHFAVADVVTPVG